MLCIEIFYANGVCMTFWGVSSIVRLHNTRSGKSMLNWHSTHPIFDWISDCTKDNVIIKSR